MLLAPTLGPLGREGKTDNLSSTGGGDACRTIDRSTSSSGVLAVSLPLETAVLAGDGNTPNRGLLDDVVVVVVVVVVVLVDPKGSCLSPGVRGGI